MTLNANSISTVPSASDFIDIVLSKTQRKTPTVIHARYKIKEIRTFYMRKIKFTSQNIHDKITKIITDFPRLDDIHPFFADLINILYERNHYKLALGQIDISRHIIDNFSKDYVRLLKYADSLYRCKTLKKAALGRMCTLIRKQKPTFEYLEQVRQHLIRLPAINPNVSTIILTGTPNAGKSCFMNKITRADVEVQPFPFTTKSLYVGHTDFKYQRFQIIDTPGLLDRPLEERNTIEMQAITALAHIHACILYMIDISESSGHSLQQQVQLFNSLIPLFSNKPIIVALSKIDLRSVDDLSLEEKELIESMKNDKDMKIEIVPLSSLTEQGIAAVKRAACDMLLEQKNATQLGVNTSMPLAHLQVSGAQYAENKNRPPQIPESVLRRKQEHIEKEVVNENEEEDFQTDPYEYTKIPIDPSKRLEKDIEREYGGAGVYNFKLSSHHLLPEDWKDDIRPEIMDGHNITDFFEPEPDILERLNELEREEEQILNQEAMQPALDWDLTSEQKEMLGQIRNKRKALKIKSQRDKSSGKPVIPRTRKILQASKIKKQLQSIGIDTTNFDESHSAEPVELDIEDKGRPPMVSSVLGKRRRSRSAAYREKEEEEVKDPKIIKSKKKSEKLRRIAQRGPNQMALAGESDRRIHMKKPKHLYSGKRDVCGKADRR